MKDLLRRPAVLVPALVYLAVSLLCAGTPLLNYLGFEFSLVIALTGTVVAGPAVIASLRRRGEGPAAAAFNRAFLQQLLLLLIPLFVMTGNALFVKNCSWLQGLAFFLLLPVVTVWFAGALGFFLAAVSGRPYLLYALAVTATLLYALALGYFTPAIFSYNLFYGFFPGLTYDETLGIATPLLTFRLFTLGLGFLLVTLAIQAAGTAPGGRPRERRTEMLRMLRSRGFRLRALPAVLALAFLAYSRTDLGWESTAASIRKALGAKYEAAHCTIYYPAEMFTADGIRRVAREHEFRLAQVAHALQLDTIPRVESYLYRSVEEKQRLVGAGATNIAKPWSGEVHVTAPALDAVLKHELVHVLAAPYGAPVLRASISTGLTEGLAMAVEWDWGSRTLHEYAAAMRRAGVLPDVAGIMSVIGFASHSSSVSYVAAGSFCRWLIDRRGMNAMTAAYRTAGMEEHFGAPLPALVARWQVFLDSVRTDETDRMAVDVLFRRPPIFRKVCARVVAERNREAERLFAARDYPAAAALYAGSYSDGRGYDALSGWLSSALQAWDFATVLAVYDTVVRRDPAPGQYLPLLATAGMAWWGSGRHDSAAACFERLARANLHGTLTEGSLTRLAAIGDGANRERLFEYFLAAAEDSVRLVMLDAMSADTGVHWLPLYLKGRVLARTGKDTASVRVLAMLGGSALPAPLHAVRLKTVGRSLYRLGDDTRALAAFEESLRFERSEFARNEVQEWRERIAFGGRQ